jgi:preprotein translocase subunit SecA
LHEYKSEGFQLFEQMLGRLRRDVTGQLMHVVLTQRMPEEFAEMALPQMQAHHLDPMTGEDEFFAEEQEASAAPKSRQERRAAAKQGNGAPPSARRPSGGVPAGKPQQARGRGQRGPALDPNNPSSWGKVSRNAPCPCGSGKKFKHCHGAIASAAAE